MAQRVIKDLGNIVFIAMDRALDLEFCFQLVGICQVQHHAAVKSTNTVLPASTDSSRTAGSNVSQPSWVDACATAPGS